MNKKAWMSDEFFEELSSFLDGQAEQLDPKDGEQRAWLDKLIAELEKGEGYQTWMTPSQFCWTVLEAIAKKNTEAIRRKYIHGRKVLILVKAQHPLTEDGMPGDEYRLRLDRAFEVAARVRSIGFEPVYMVVGGVHAGCDTVTLADAGAHYLIKNGVPETSIIRRPAIYSGNDEDWVACDEVLNGPQYRDLIIVGSTGQYPRSYMSCLLKGLIPKHEMVTFWEPHQKPILELAGPWSVGGFFAKGPMEVFRQAVETARRHREEAKRDS